MEDQKNKRLNHYSQFHKIGKIYYLTDWAGILINAMTEVCVAFRISAKGKVVLIRYGDPVYVRSWYEKLIKEMAAYPPVSGSSVVLFTSTFEVEELNKLIQEQSYAQTFHDEIFSENKTLPVRLS